MNPIARIATLCLLAAGMMPQAAGQSSVPLPARAKRDALEWLDGFARYQVLFHADDVKKLRSRVEAMTPEEAVKWWEQTAPQRKVLASPEWSETEDWLRRFLSVQAKYSDEEIRERQKEAADKAGDSAESLQKVLDRINKARRMLVGGAKGAEETRQLQLAANRAYRQEEVRQREAARARAQAAPSPSLAPAPRPAASRTRYNEPLIDSLDVARWTILRELYPRW